MSSISEVSDTTDCLKSLMLCKIQGRSYRKTATCKTTLKQIFSAHIIADSQFLETLQGIFFYISEGNTHEIPPPHFQACMVHILKDTFLQLQKLWLHIQNRGHVLLVLYFTSTWILEIWHWKLSGLWATAIKAEGWAEEILAAILEEQQEEPPGELGWRGGRVCFSRLQFSSVPAARPLTWP